jgi:hypothetical protein
MSISFNPDRSDVLDTEGVTAAIIVTTTPIEAKVGASPLPGRQLLIIQPKANNVFLGYSDTFTTAQGIELFKDQLVSISVGPSVHVWLRTSSGSVNVRVQELA